MYANGVGGNEGLPADGAGSPLNKALIDEARALLLPLFLPSSAISLLFSIIAFLPHPAPSLLCVCLALPNVSDSCVFAAEMLRRD